MLDFQHHQKVFVEHIRDPQHKPIPQGVEERRMQVYRELLFNNILGFLENGFPVLKSLYTEEQWQHLVRQFFIKHSCSSPHFVDISGEFVNYLQNGYAPNEDDPAFLLELAHYEWLELDVSIRDVPDNIIETESNAAIKAICFSPLATLVGYQYPVHRISVEYQPKEPQEYSYLVVYRNPRNEVKFTEVNGLTAHLLTIVQQKPAQLLEEYLQTIQVAVPHLSEEQLAEGMQQIIRKLLQQQILVSA